MDKLIPIFICVVGGALVGALAISGSFFGPFFGAILGFMSGVGIFWN